MRKIPVLSKRLQMNVSMVTPGYRMADIGCDHAHVPIYLVKRGITPGVIAMDVRKGPLEHAKVNITHFGCEQEIEIRLSDGLHELQPGEADIIMIAGMGGALTVQILEEGKECMQSARELVLQPQSDRGVVRRFLYREGFSIIAEDMCFEDGKYYNVMRAENRRINPGTELRECDYEYGKILLDGKHPVLYDYLKEEYRKALLVKQNLMEHQTQNTRQRLPGFLQEFTVLQEALDCYTCAGV